MKFLSVLMLSLTALSASMDLSKVFGPGKMSWLIFNDVYSAANFSVTDLSASMTKEFLAWFGYAPVTPVCFCLAVFFWILRPGFLKELIADWR